MDFFSILEFLFQRLIVLQIFSNFIIFSNSLVLEVIPNDPYLLYNI